MSATKFTIWSPAIYAEMHAVIAEVIKPNTAILDLGPYEGNLEDYMDGLGIHLSIEAVDVDPKPLNALALKEYTNIAVNTVCEDGNQYLKNCEKKYDMVLSNASIHEMNDPSDQERYLDWFFSKQYEILNEGGQVVIGDLYFPSWIPDEDVDAFRDFQWKTIRHASERREFVFPELIDAAASKNGFRLISKNEIRAVEEIDRRFYVFVFTKA